MKDKHLICLLIALGIIFNLTNGCKKDDKKDDNKLESDSITVSDIEGNIYHTIIIGTQTWMKENLKTTEYRDGSSISNITDNNEWMNQNTGAYCWYNNDANSYKTSYGALYNWYTVVDSRSLCPTGWHVPTDNEWNTLISFLGGENVSGGKLKATRLWVSPNTSADNSSGFTALPGGARDEIYGKFFDVGKGGNWWSSTMFYSNRSWYSYLDTYSAEARRYTTLKQAGFSIRCIQD